MSATKPTNRAALRRRKARPAEDRPRSPRQRRTAILDIDNRVDVRQLFENLKKSLPTLERLLDECSGHWGYEDPIYRFYHQSFKVYALQETTGSIVTALQALAPERKLHDWFMQLVKDGTGRTFEREHNRRWLEVVRPIVDAFFHAHYFLEMAVRYGKRLKFPPRTLPSGWAAFLYLYELR